MAVGTGATAAVSVLLWFRKGLRLHDSAALAAACEGATHVYPVFCLDPWFVGSGRVGPTRLRFLAESLQDLDASLRARGSRLIVLRGSAEVEIPAALAAFGASRLVYEADGVEPFAIERDGKIAAAARAAGATVVETAGHTLLPLAAYGGRGVKPITTYATFLTAFEKARAAHPLALAPTPPDRLPPPGAAPAAADGAKTAAPTVAEVAPSLAGAAASRYPGGETEGLRRLRVALARDSGGWAAEFEKPTTSPAALDPFGAGTASTTCLSPYLKFGCVSARTFWLELAAATAAAPAARKRAAPPGSLKGQLLWREFFYACAAAVGPTYGQMADNPICRQVPWRPVEADGAAAADLAAWRAGRTGYPWIDACMRQLATEGWLHHLGRHSVACFLTRGDLWISWEEGAAVFDELLVDADWAVNSGNWMWLSCSCFFYQYFRCYSPVAFGKKYDADGAYIRKYVPELARFPAKYIYEPWKAPIADQTKAGCRVGVDYPKPIVAHDVASKANMGLMADAYRAYKEGDAGTSASGGGGAAAPAAKAKGAKDGAVSAGAAGRKRALGS